MCPVVALLSLTLVAGAEFAFASPPPDGATPVTSSAWMDPLTAPSTTMILTRDLRRLRGTLVAIDGRQVSYRDRAGTLGAVAASDVVAIIRVGPPPGHHGPVVNFADGQRLPGAPEVRGGGLQWRHSVLGTLALDTERLASILLKPGPETESRLAAASETREDLLLLSNGDRLEGIVSALGPTITLERADGSAQSIPLERVDAIAFVHRRVSAPAAWPATIWLSDGSVLHAERPTLADDGILRLRPELAPISEGAIDRPFLIPETSILGIGLIPDVVIPLASLPVVGVTVPPYRLNRPVPLAMDQHAPLGLAAVELQGPLTVRYRLPAAGLRFVAHAVMPDEARSWGDLELVLIDGGPSGSSGADASERGTERFRARLGGEERSVLIDIQLTTAELTIRVEEGGRGPILDRILLVEAIFGSAE